MAWIAGNRFLSMSEMENNATLIWNFFGNRGWTIEAVSGMLGNMQSESSINPAIWQDLSPWGDPTYHGYGLVQWTPYTKITEWLVVRGYDISDGYGQCERIQEELESGLQWIPSETYPISFEEFSQSTDSPYELGMTFLYNYERPSSLNQPNRGKQAEYWYTFLSGKDPEPPIPDPTFKPRKMPVWMYCKLF